MNRFEFTTLVVIGTDCTGSCKSNYHTITTTTAPANFVWLYMLMTGKIYHCNESLLGPLLKEKYIEWHTYICLFTADTISTIAFITLTFVFPFINIVDTLSIFMTDTCYFITTEFYTKQQNNKKTISIINTCTANT